MKDAETQNRFVCLRAEGWSFARIAEQLQVSKPILIKWSRKFQFEIQNQRAIFLEQLQEKWLATRETRVGALGETLRKAESELAKLLFFNRPDRFWSLYHLIQPFANLQSRPPARDFRRAS